jgi:hypothetical protein
MFARDLGVDAIDARMSIGTAQDRHVEHAGELNIIDIGGLASNQARIFTPFDWRTYQSCNTHT